MEELRQQHWDGQEASRVAFEELCAMVSALEVSRRIYWHAVVVCSTVVHIKYIAG